MDLATLRAHKNLARIEYERQNARNAGSGNSGGYEYCGPPHWDRAAWDAFKTQYGKYPYSAGELPPTFAGCPDWAYKAMGLRVPPVTVSPT